VGVLPILKREYGAKKLLGHIAVRLPRIPGKPYSLSAPNSFIRIQGETVHPLLNYQAEAEITADA